MTPRQILDMAGYYCYGGEAAAALNQSLEFDREALVRFARSVIEAERESSDKPVAWMDTSGRIKGIPANIGSNECAPLYRRPQPARKLTDEEIEELYMQMIERRINGEEE